MGNIVKTESDNKLDAKNKCVENVKNYVLKFNKFFSIKEAVAFDKLMKEYNEADEEQKKVMHDEFYKKLRKLSINFGLETHLPLKETMNPKYQTLIVNLCNQIIQEYDCQNPSEIMLVEIMVNAYIRLIEYSGILNINISEGLLDKEVVQFYGILSKEIDRANRQYINALATLKQIKLPNIDIKIKANTAFIAEKQQINALDKNQSI